MLPSTHRSATYCIFKFSTPTHFWERSHISDLGSASLRGASSPRDHLWCAGDPSYAPPETLYGYVDPDWSWRRLGCDVYLLGSMIVYFFTGLSMTGLFCDELDANYHWKNWAGTYSDVLPYVRDAFGRAAETFRLHVPNALLAKELKPMVSQLCEPDPKLRGHPHNRLGSANPLSLEKYVSTLDLLARRAGIGLFRT